MFRLIVAFTLIASPGLSQDRCEDLWFTRNQVFDRAGYCFGTALGQALFDNSGCTGGTPALTARDQALVGFIRAYEQELSCAVDTGRGGLDIPLVAMRRSLENLPVKSEYASGCLDWQGGAIPLRGGHRADAPVFGQVFPGDDIVWEYETPFAPDGWEFITVYRGSEPVLLGWSDTPVNYDLCGGLAG